jgi:hypothetical protein
MVPRNGFVQELIYVQAKRVSGRFCSIIAAIGIASFIVIPPNLKGSEEKKVTPVIKTSHLE